MRLRNLSHVGLVLAFVSAVSTTGVVAQQTSPVPAKRLAFSGNTDLAGRDLQQIFDTTLDACMAACVDNNACTALTFNARNGSCFPKADVTGAAPFSGAFSGIVLETDAKVMARAADRGRAIGFLPVSRIEGARSRVAEFGKDHDTGTASVDELRAAFLDALANDDAEKTQRILGTLIVLTDAADLWVDYARRTLDNDGSNDVAI